MPQSQITDQPMASQERDINRDSHNTIQLKQSAFSSLARLLLKRNTPQNKDPTQNYRTKGKQQQTMNILVLVFVS